MKKIITITAVALSAFALSACAAPQDGLAFDDEVVATDNVTDLRDDIWNEPISAESGPVIDSIDLTIEEQSAVTVYEEKFGDKYAEGERLFLDTAYATCEGFAVGLTPVDVLYIGLDAGLTTEEVAMVNAAAVFAYCPQYTYLVTG